MAPDRFGAGGAAGTDAAPADACDSSVVAASMQGRHGRVMISVLRIVNFLPNRESGAGSAGIVGAGAVDLPGLVAPELGAAAADQQRTSKMHEGRAARRCAA